MAEPLKKCAQCGIDAPLRCARCGNSFYCSATCQKQHWTSHKPSCVAKPTYTAPSDSERCLKCKGWGKDLLGEDQMCAHCRGSSA
jgi:hypothetical protein